MLCVLYALNTLDYEEKSMKKVVVILVSILLIAMTLPNLAVAEIVFAFEVPSYSVFVSNSIKIKVVVQGTSEPLTYNWKSSNTEIATVKSGTVQGISEGSVDIICTATLKNGEVYTASCVVNVNIPVKSIKVAEESVTVAPSPISFDREKADVHYYMFTPAVTITPENATIKDIEWSTSNPQVATISKDGVVTGYSYGKSTITGKATDGSGAKVSYTVNVPKCFVTDSKLTIKEDAGVILGYCYAITSGINRYSTKIEGKYFTTESQGTFDGMTMLRIVPVKAGSGSITFYHNGNKLKTVNITVEKSAIRDNDSYPEVDIISVVTLPESYIGKQVQLTGTLFSCDALPTDSFVYSDIFDKYKGEYSGVAYAFTGGETRQYFSFEYKQATILKFNESYTIYGTIDHFFTYTSETGLSYCAPYLTNVTIK